ncbi:hypothetical protein NSU_2264 [Novosphingobium pentaromativorans US6-1]|uniref:Uncharacterized protein n=1 Tax=Novosphingobium pentaromativorans US6-1 TaxID=1088721 RepID=G6ED43_9SPHN|nr:hypothetical protein NSU_2264 [Novosphingobium pentaromativorans US6-1]
MIEINLCPRLRPEQSLRRRHRIKVPGKRGIGRLCLVPRRCLAELEDRIVRLARFG